MKALEKAGIALKAKREELHAFLATMKTGGGFERLPTPEENVQINSFNAKLSELQAEYNGIKSITDADLMNETELKAMRERVSTDLPRPDEDSSDVYKRLSRMNGLKCFKALGTKSAEQRAYDFGMYVLGAVFLRPDALAYCKKQGMKTFNYVSETSGEIKAMSEGTNSTGGALVPEEFSQELIDLREMFGALRQSMQVEPMSSDNKRIARRASGPTVYYPGEGQTITASDLSYDSVLLTAIKFAGIGRYSSELGEDAVVDFGDRIALEFAQAFAAAEDNNGFNGDGTSTYGSWVGLLPKIKGLSSTISYIAGLTVGDGNLYSELTLPNHLSVVGNLPVFADGPNAAWYVNKLYFYSVMVKLAMSSGGVSEAEVIKGQRIPMFIGYPVKFVQKMARTEANSQVCALLGDINKAAALGDRRIITVAKSTEVYFTTDELAVRATQRVAFNAHDVGNADATAANRLPGPVVGLITAAS